MSDGVTSLSFVSQHGLVREALEAALPRLREMFDQSDISLLNVNVSDRDSAGYSNQHRLPYELTEDNDAPRRSASAQFETAGIVARQVNESLLDVYI